MYHMGIGRCISAEQREGHILSMLKLRRRQGTGAAVRGGMEVVMRFTVVTVCLNPGRKLEKTLESILKQSCTDVEVVLKDGGSTDGAVAAWQQKASEIPGGERVRVYTQKDKGIYDAMNQAVSYARGEFVIFLNCGDTFYDHEVLERVNQVVEARKLAGEDCGRLVLYGDTYSGKNNALIAAAPAVTGFTCYRNIPCHQSCVYSTVLCREKKYDLKYSIRADYDHFLWCFYRAKAEICPLGFPVASYEGGGYSESRENRTRDRQEHRQITSCYMGRGELMKYRLIMACTLAPLRRAMAESSVLSGVYHWMKECLYRRK